VLRALLRHGTGPRRMTAIRQQLFAAATGGAGREQALASVAAAHGLSATALARELFADLPHERRVVWPQTLEPAWFSLVANRAIAQSLLVQADAATLFLAGASRALLRTAWLLGTGLALEGMTADGVRLRWRRGEAGRSARSLAALVCLLPWSRRYRLRARCAVLGLEGTFVLTTGDPILPGPEPRRFDSKLERDFARDFATAAPDWDLLREPVPVAIAGGLAFPDFELRKRASPGRWLLEIAGLRDPSALAGRLALLAAEPRYVLCVPRRLVPVEWTGHPRLVPFSRRVAVPDVLARVGALCP
jgi:predicted nuclease of restriction endonuclease-like RecB superfamily